jgi:hypothetical protein
MDAERVRSALVPTGDPRVDAAINGLASIEDVDLAGRPAILEAVHDRLREILGELGDPGRPSAGGQSGQVRPGEPGRRGEQGVLGAGLPPRPDSPRPNPPWQGTSGGGAGPRPGMASPGSWPRRPNG